MFYVYEWFVLSTGEIFYVGKGCRGRYKSKRNRNRLFNFYIDKFECGSRIIKRFESEDDAFKYEKQRILELKSIGLCKCNLDNGGTGGVNFIWTDELREYKSIYNPMKSEIQRERMSKNNPMKNPEIAKSNGLKKRRSVVINGVVYNGVKFAASQIGVCEFTVLTWCKRGYDTNGNPCRYFDEPQKEYPNVKKLHPKTSTPKPVIVNGKWFYAVKDAAKFIGTSSTYLVKCLKDGKNCKGYKCEYDDQQPSHENSEISIVEGSTTNE